MSDSWIDLKLRIEEPSNIWPVLNASSSKDAAGTLKCCMIPGRSQNLMSMNLTSSSLMKARTSSAFVNMDCLLGGPTGSGTTLRGGGFGTVTLLFRECYAVG